MLNAVDRDAMSGMGVVVHVMYVQQLKAHGLYLNGITGLGVIDRPLLIFLLAVKKTRSPHEL